MLRLFQAMAFLCMCEGCASGGGARGVDVALRDMLIVDVR
jgi:hypothetical protein